jgi:hypothetical protein
LRKLEQVTKLMLAISERDSAPPSPRPKMSRTKRFPAGQTGFALSNVGFYYARRLNRLCKKMDGIESANKKSLEGFIGDYLPPRYLKYSLNPAG